VIQIRRTEKYFGRRFGRQPEGDESQKRQKNARDDQDDQVEDRNAFYDDRKGQVGERLLAARVEFDVLLRRASQQIPLVALHVTRSIDLKRATTYDRAQT